MQPDEGHSYSATRRNSCSIYCCYIHWRDIPMLSFSNVNGLACAAG